MHQRDDSTSQYRRLLDLAAQGNGDAYDQLLVRASDQLYALTRRMLRKYPHLRRWEQTDDVFQNAVFRLHRSLETTRPSSPHDFLALAATQIRRALIDLARHHFGPLGHAAHHHSGGGETGAQRLLQQQPAPTCEPETLDAWARFHEVIDSLPEKERETFGLIWYGGATTAEAANAQGVSQKTVLRRLQKARLLISRAMRGQTLPLQEDRES